jgi:hypothetical protein
LHQVGELVKLKGGSMDDDLKSQFNAITTTILSNQTEALKNLTDKVSQTWIRVLQYFGPLTYCRPSK